MPGDNFTQDDYIAQFGTEEEELAWAERKKVFEQWISQFPVTTVEDVMKNSFNMDKFK